MAGLTRETRRISTFFQLTKHWKDYDLFARQKIDTFRTSRSAVLELASRYKELVGELRANKDVTHDAEAEKLLFAEFFEICLWGNATDLSLLTNMTYEDIQKLQGSVPPARPPRRTSLINDLPASYEILSKARDEGRRSEESISSSTRRLRALRRPCSCWSSSATGLATQIVLRPKSIPWFVSDVLPGDFTGHSSMLFSNPKVLLDSRTTMRALQGKAPSRPHPTRRIRICSLFTKTGLRNTRDGQLILAPNRYWTRAAAFGGSPPCKQAPELYEDLKRCRACHLQGRS